MNYYIFSRYSNKLDRIYLQEHLFEDETGWIFNRHKYMSYWGTKSIEGDNYVPGEKDILRKGSNSRLYSLNIYLNLGINYHTRTYKKLYEILSEIFPMIRTIVSFFSFLSDIMNELNSSKKLNEFILEIDKKKKKGKNKINSKNLQEINISNISNKNNNNNLFKKTNGNSFKLEELNHKSVILNNIDDSSKLYCLPINNNNTNKKEIKRSKKKSAKTVIDISIKNTINNYDTVEKIKFPLRYYLYGFFLIKIKSRKFKNSCISEKFSKSFIFYSRLIDISTYIALFKQFELFKKIVSNKLKINEEEINRRDDLLLRNNRFLSNYDKMSHKLNNFRPIKSITLINRK